ncbi:MAG: hypothetical protein ABIK82_09290 [Pseudomonadota bacterium]
MWNSGCRSVVKSLAAGWVGGFIGNGFLGAMFSMPFVLAILYDPNLQSELFRTVTPTRNIPVSVVGLVVLSGLHGLFFNVLRNSIPGDTWVKRGLWWGFCLWAVFWLAQEWFIYVTLLREPVLLASLELVILLGGSLIEGVVIAAILDRSRT